MFLDTLVKTLALASEHNGSWGSVVDPIVRFGAALVETIDPEALLLELFERLADIGDANQGQVFDSSGRGARDGFGQGSGAAFRHYDGIGPRGMGGTDDGAEVVGIFDAIEKNEQARVPGNGIQLRITVGCAEGDNALVRDAFGRAIQRFARFKPQGNGAFATEFDDFLNARTGHSFGDQNFLERALGAQGFTNRMDAEKQGHVLL